MAQKDKDLKIQLDSLLKAYSVKDITLLFAKIDERLISLHERSAEDFLKLNASYKDVYKQSNEISKSIVEVISEFSIDKNDNLYHIINALFEKLKAQNEVLDYKIQVISDQLEKLINQIRHVFFPIKNYNQNLIGLKYLIANLKVSLSYRTKDTDHLEEAYSGLENLIDTIKKFSDNISNSLNQFSKNAKNTQKELCNLISSGEINIEDLLSEIQSSVSLIERKNEENKKLVPLIKECIDTLQDSNSEIIKKLQYQDIIKQKMDHIQETHKDLINELDEFGDTDDEQDKLNEKVKCFLRIRDISGLQAAQLMQANKEYQSAIEVITNNFILIGDNIREVTEKSEKMYSFGKIDYNKMFEKIGSYIVKADHYLNDYNAHTNKLEEETSEIHKQFLQIGFSINNFRKYTQELEKSLKEYNKYISKEISKEQEFGKANNQFKGLLKEIEENKNKLNTFFDQIISLKTNIEGFANKTDNSLLGETDFSDFRKILDSLKKKGLDIESAMSQNNKSSKNVIENIKSSITKIKYYEYFEKIIQEIISELNSVNLKLKLNKNEEISKEENLEMIKQYYTMETEHNIHDKIAKGDDIDIDFDIKEDDDIEFF